MNFEDYHLKPNLLKALELLGYKKPAKVQEMVLPKALAGKDLIVKSQTGSGKTAAFAIPVCEKIIWEENKPQALVLAPTRELAMQIAEEFFNIGRFERTKVVSLYGKAPFKVQEKALKQKTHVVVGTPGRVMDHLERGTLDVSHIGCFVIDEADELLQMGFREQMDQIIKSLPEKRQTLLFSATYGQQVKDLCDSFMAEPETIEIASQSLTVEKIEQGWYEAATEEKPEALMDLMIMEKPETCMIFANRIGHVEEITRFLKEKGLSVRMLHGDMEQKDREAVMADFRRGRFRYLVSTDVAARGIDVEHVTHVVNYEVPENREFYVHRIGRTGRAGRTGKSLLLVAPEEKGFLKEIQKYIQKEIPEKKLPDKEVVEKEKKAFEAAMAAPVQKQVSKGEKLSKDIMKLHINAGKKTKMRPVDIVGTLCHLKGMTAQDIGIINILDISTFVEILNGKGESVYKQLQTTPIKGRLRRVSKADQIV